MNASVLLLMAVNVKMLPKPQTIAWTVRFTTRLLQNQAFGLLPIVTRARALYKKPMALANRVLNLNFGINERCR